MPSPIAHITAGFIIGSAMVPAMASTSTRGLPRQYLLPISVSLAASMMPDLDSTVGVATGQFAKYHNNLTHSLIVGMMVAPVFALFVARRSGTAWFRWLAVVWIAYAVHVIMDYFTIGRGVMMFWPLTSARFRAPISLFYGFHWSDGLVSSRHLTTLWTELAFAVFGLGIAYLVMWRRRQPLQSDA